MKHIKLTTIALSILALTLVVWTTWTVTNCQPKQQTTYEQVKARTDSVITVNVNKPDSAKLQVIEDFKLRVAKARFLDSLQRAANNR